jgi:hypothetical protein
MSNGYKDSKFKELLDKLQQESWQLELLISGFAIFGLISGFPHIETAFNIAENSEQTYASNVLRISLISCSILIFNLVIHVILRGLWIGALGLRYISGDIEFDQLKYQSNFTKHLKKKIISFDRYIGRLEDYCSVMFAVSFLLIFYLISLFIVIFSIVFILNLLINNNDIPQTLRYILGFPILIFIILGALLVFIDFVTQGFLKKKKWLSKIYFPFYLAFSYLTLTFLYRPLVYNFLDNKFTKRISFFLIPIYIAILFLLSFKVNNTNYLTKAKYVSEAYVHDKNYENLLEKEDDLAKVATIQSKVIQEPYLKVFKVFREQVENEIYSYHPSLKPENDTRGLKSNMISFASEIPFKKRDSLTNKYLEIFNNTHQVFIDSLQFQSEFLISKNKKNQPGFETFINIKNLHDGKHSMILKRIYIQENDTLTQTEINIPFWYFKL